MTKPAATARRPPAAPKTGLTAALLVVGTEAAAAEVVEAAARVLVPVEVPVDEAEAEPVRVVMPEAEPVAEAEPEEEPVAEAEPVAALVAPEAEVAVTTPLLEPEATALTELWMTNWVV